MSDERIAFGDQCAACNFAAEGNYHNGKEYCDSCYKERMAREALWD